MADPTPRRRIGVITSSRADFGLWRPVLHELGGRDSLDVALFVTGTHLSDAHGRTVQEIVEAGWKPAAEVPIPMTDDSPRGIGRAMGKTLEGFADVYSRESIDILMVLGDRFEMFAAAAAAVPHRIPLGHVHGGEVTVGAFDDAFRHGLTKMSHLHFCSTSEYRDRIVQLGESPERVFVTGAPGLDNLDLVEPMTDAELDAKVGLPISKRPPLLVTYHPVTLRESAGRDIEALLEALETFDHPMVFTAPNADTDSGTIRAALEEFVARREDAVLVESLGTRAYFASMSRALAMVGNSSSGIIEAASFGLPVVNIGDRQAGRVRGANVVDVECDTGAIRAAIARATEPGFRESARRVDNPYGDGSAARRIADVLESVELGPELIMKPFHDIEIG